MNPSLKLTNLDSVVSFLQAKGLSRKHLEEFLVNLNNIVAEQTYKRMMLELSEEDIKYLETLPQEQFDIEVSKKYQEVSGKTPQQLTQEILDTISSSILEETSKEETPK